LASGNVAGSRTLGAILFYAASTAARRPGGRHGTKDFYMNFHFVFSSLALIAFSISVILFIVLHIKNKEYTVFKNAVSDYDIGNTHKLFQIYLWIGTIGFLFILLSIFVNTKIELDKIYLVLIGLVILFRIGISFFKTDLENTKLSMRGIIHYLFAIGNFGFAYTFIVKFDIRSKSISELQSIQSLITTYELILTIALIGVVITMFKPLRILFGVIERVYLLGILLWFIGFCYINLFIV
jgi:Protein of unknown function (DUF998)